MRYLAVLLLVACSHKEAQHTPPPTTDPTARYAEGKALMERGALDSAEAAFYDVTRAGSSPSDDPALRANAMLGLAELRKERGDARGALLWAEKVVALRPDDLDALDVEAGLAHEAGDLKIEIATRETIVKLRPDALDDWLALAGALTVGKETERAKTAFLGYEDTRVRLVTALGKDHDAGVRRQAATELGAAHDASTARALVLSMTDKDASVREAAVRAVTEVGIDLDPEVRPALQKLASLEKDAGVQSALRDALATPAPKSPEPATKK